MYGWASGNQEMSRTTRSLSMVAMAITLSVSNSFLKSCVISHCMWLDFMACGPLPRRTWWVFLWLL
ncbi:Orf1 7.5 kDa protein [Human mastadenovirus D]|uniref:Orf1 7.5 kDa protein n=4 Tax=Human mastadenovirus D TaxID=130310 RepID=M0QV29_9ADEN|nr:Orf1 7.5 kDa protein [Human adenovirus 33]AFK92745.1 Orf1 7.5 kDa protein [Human adenovirus 43]AFK92865.1 Orf1 7.5 kDa protein [Human adenovirus 51]ATU83176.1 Orf1 7.5 kDa protein [Human mastadenovirus D]WOZ23574.1 Orf1 7.5 kDa protein [Human adenovirus 51]